MTLDERRLVNPWRLWHGAFVPEWLMRRPEPSAGAKLAYARLCRFAGKEGVARPSLEELADELGVSERQARRYTKELQALGLVDVVQRGLNAANVYVFPAHAWMRLEGETVDPGPDTYGRPGPDTCDRPGEDTSGRPGPAGSGRLERPDMAGPSSNSESQFESQAPSAENDGDGARARRRPRDVLWDALIVVLGHEPQTRSERGAWNAAVTQLRDAGATPDAISARARQWPNRYPGATLTATALARHWGELAPRRTVVPLDRGRSRPPCGWCDGTGFVERGDGVAPCPSCNARKEALR